jgi:hypothetical protein
MTDNGTSLGDIDVRLVDVEVLAEFVRVLLEREDYAVREQAGTEGQD